jgi:hypothetical protein
LALLVVVYRRMGKELELLLELELEEEGTLLPMYMEDNVVLQGLSLHLSMQHLFYLVLA